MVELYIKNIIQNKTFQPLVEDEITWTTHRSGEAGKLTFNVIKDSIIDFTEGNPVKLFVDGTPIFYGFVFQKKRDKKHNISVTAYDQMYYLTNKDSDITENETASDVIKKVAVNFKLNVGEIAATSYKIASRVESNVSGFDIIYNALDMETTNNKTMYVLYDDFGKLTLKKLEDMKLDIVLDAESGENFDYSTSISDDTYNKIKLTYDNDTTGKRDVYIAQDGDNINNWGVLQYYDTLQEHENGQAKADALLELYNAKTRKLKLTKIFGNLGIRAGNMLIVNLGVGDMDITSYLLVEKCEHTFGNNEHFMDLTMRGGEIIG